MNTSRTPIFLYALGLLGIAMLVAALLGGCSDADVASTNLSTAADNFQITRRIVFYNGVTGEYILQLEGLCSLGNDSTATELNVTCKVGDGLYKKHFLGLSDNVTYFAEQIDGFPADPYHYRVIFKPETILPTIEVK